jgi:CubicO group peptidase (beta-lactamase class C family)
MKLALILGLTAITVSYAQNCPLLGPAYPAATAVNGAALLSATEKFEAALASSTDIDKDAVSYAFGIYRARQGHAEPIYQTFNTARSRNASMPVGPDTLFRIQSISKVITVYTMLAKLSFQHWHEPVSKFIPELADLPSPPQDVIRQVDWSEVTLESLASQISGIAKECMFLLPHLKVHIMRMRLTSRGDAFNDVSSVLSTLPGLRALNDSEIVRCGAAPLKACTRADALKYIRENSWPVFPSFHSPTYSSMAFELLAWAVENITSTPFADLVQDAILRPLNLTRTFLTHPGNDTDAVVVAGWDLDFGDGAPYVQPLPLLSSALKPQVRVLTPGHTELAATSPPSPISQPSATPSSPLPSSPEQPLAAGYARQPIVPA